MKVYKNNYKDHWISPITMVEYMFFWTDWSKCGRQKGYVSEKDWVDSPKWADKLSDYLKPISVAIQWVWDNVDRKIDYVKIDNWDTWSMDSTLAPIILPMLKQLKATKHGSPHVADEDVPEYLRSHMAQPKEYEWDTDSLWHMRWDWVMDEMIFAFEHLVDDSWEEEFWSGEYGTGKTFEETMDSNTRKWDREGQQVVEDRINNGLCLFGKYFRALWD